MVIKRSLVRYSIAAFFILAMLLGGGTIYLVVQGVLPAEMALASALSTTIAGIIMTAVEDGRAGLRLMWSRMLIWRVGMGYWLFAFLFLIPILLIGSVTALPAKAGEHLGQRMMQPSTLAPKGCVPACKRISL